MKVFSCFAVILSAFLLYSCDVMEYVPKDGLVANYPFKGNADDASGNSLHGTVHGASPVPDRLGNKNNAFSFDGSDDYIVLGDDFDLPERSISFRFMARTIPVYETDPLNYSSWTSLLVSNHPHMKNGGFHIVVTNVGGVDKICAWKVGMTEVFDINLVGAPIQKLSWYDVTFTTSRESIKIYLNGDLIAAFATEVQISSQFGNSRLIVGCGRNLDLRFFHGIIDNVLIHDRVLEESEIKKMSQAK